MIGAELGYVYEGSPLVIPDAGASQRSDFISYRPNTAPGARLPHVWLADGSAVQDRIGYDLAFTLLRFCEVKVDSIANAFASLGAPFRILDLCDRRARELYGADLLLLRPDLHVAWRGNTAPHDAMHLARRVTGQGAPPARGRTLSSGP
jgi:hypothetical protein